MIINAAWLLRCGVLAGTAVVVSSWSLPSTTGSCWSPTSSSCRSSSRSSSALHVVDPAGVGTTDASDMLYKEQENILVERGEFEGTLMADTHTPIVANVVKGAGSSGGFGGGGKSPKQQLKTQGKAHAAVLRRDGVVRIDNVLPADQADQVREFAYDLRQVSEGEVSRGEVAANQRFANVLLKENRCDLTIPLGSKVIADALYNMLLESAVGQTMQTLLGPDAILYELSCMMSDPGSQRQVVHPDTPCVNENDDPVLYTCFVALQDVQLDMGPTTWLPGTHTVDNHRLFRDESIPEDSQETNKDKLLRTQPSVLGLLPKGSCGIFDSRLLHCGGANTSQTSRAIFYFSFKNHKVANAGNPGSIRMEYISKFALSELEKELTLYAKGKDSPRIYHS
jgi:ectoine hydroxylase-related dioxygenase (phytanoyl-CoA dioxygenase family)